MKRVSKTSKKGFTLVELIVVLVILAILAAMLVPALTGYIKRARQEKDYNAAAEVLTAAQSVIVDYYGKTPESQVKPSAAAAYVESHISDINTLTGLSLATGDVSNVQVGTNYTITSITVKLNGNEYSWNGSTWNDAISNT